MIRYRGLLLDRDGVINVDHGYIGKPEQFTFMPGLFAFLIAAQNKGYKLAILTNQSGVARGKYSAEDYYALTNWMLSELRKHGTSIDLVLHSFEHPEGTVPTLSRESYWRKPNPGMVQEAILKMQLDPVRSAFLGDQPRDLQAAQVAGIANCLLLDKEAKQAPMANVQSITNFDAALASL
jgi:D-glycero-D-manno-heptose 1,7-bisphosphate phosphatase